MKPVCAINMADLKTGACGQEPKEVAGCWKKVTCTECLALWKGRWPRCPCRECSPERHTARPRGEQVAVAGVLRHWWNKEHSHRPYRGIIHDEGTDEPKNVSRDLDRVLDELDEGEVVEIVVRRTGRRGRHADRPWCLIRPHEYGPCPGHGGE